MKNVIRYGKITLALLLLLAVITYTVIPLLPVKADPADAFHSEWVLVRDTADEDGATFAATYDLTTEGNFANKDSSTVANGGAYQISPRAGLNNRWMFAFCGKNYNNTEDTFSFNLIGWSKDNGMLQVIAEGNCVLGTQGVIVYPDGGDALGELVSMTGITYDDSGGAQDNYFSKTDVGLNVVAGMMAYVTGTNITSGYYQVTIVTDDDNIKIAVTATNDNTDSTVDINPAMWADTIALDETTKWTSTINGAAASSGNKGVLEVLNADGSISAGEVAAIVVDLKGIDWVQVVIYDADAATGEQAGDITVFGRKF